ncbi:MAG: glucosamine-6-phosphate deaminase [Oscillospiraceae bacterium]|nr:glucosamine-6-phosphate deaminase [Oscillospiraceae bacterium]
MKKIVLETYEDVCRAAADIFSEQLRQKPDSVLGLATGSTPIGLYAELVRRYEAGDVDFSKARSFNLDEYYPISKSNPQSYFYFMRKHLFDKVNLRHFCLPDGEAADAQAECKRYDTEIAAAGGIDLMLLGIGLNGHIGFNEPASSYPVGTHLAVLSESTISANSRFFALGEAQPVTALTMGIGGILRSKKIVFVISGKSKADITKKLFDDAIHMDVPGSFVLLHPDVTVLLDREASGG